MDSVNIWRRVLIVAIAAVLVAVAVGGLYLWYAWSKVGSDPASGGVPLTSVEQQRRVLDSFNAPVPTSTSAQGSAPADLTSPETPSVFDAPSRPSSAAVQGQGQTPTTPNSFDAPQ